MLLLCLLRYKRILKPDAIALEHQSYNSHSSSTLTARQNGRHLFHESLNTANRPHDQDGIIYFSRAFSHATLRVKLKRGPPPVSFIPPELLSDDDMECTDPGRSLPYNADSPEHGMQSSDVGLSPAWYWDEPSLVGTPISFEPLRTRSEPSLPRPETPASLYRNLLYLLPFRTPSATLPALLDYHDLHPGLRSIRSYNLLISIALRHASFGSVPWLLSALRKDGMRGNLETSKLTIRWLVQTGNWDQAWNQVFGSAKGEEVTSSMSRETRGNRTNKTKRDIPLAIWLEFFRTLKRGTVNKRVRGCWRTNKLGEVLLQQPSEAVPEPAHPATLHSARYDALMKKRPVMTAKEIVRTPPRLLYFVVTAMLHSKERETALALTTSYMKCLPLVVDDRWSRACLDIIHLFIVFGSSKEGLQKLYEAHRTLILLLALHPSLRPTSTTLFLLLGSLRRTKRCGTIAWNILQNFKGQWGPRVEDRRVRRRIASFAMKEGRADIVEEIFGCEQVLRWSHRTWSLQRHVLGDLDGFPSGRFLQSPGRKIFRGNGKEERLWCLLKKRAHRTRQKREIKDLKN